MIIRLFSILSLIVIFTNSYCNKILILNDKQDNYLLDSFLSIYIDSTNSNDLNKILNIVGERKFKECKINKPNLGYSRNTLWLYFSIQNKSHLHNWCLNISNPTINKVELFMIDSNMQIYDTLYSGLDFPSDKVNFIYKNPAFYLHIQDKLQLSLLLKIRSYSTFLLPIKIQSLKSFFKDGFQDRTSILIFFGMLISLLIVNLVLYIIIKERNYFYLVLYLVFIIIHLITLYGYINEFIPGLTIRLKSIIWFICFSISGLFITLFAMNYLNISRYKVLNRIFQFIILVHLVHIIIPLFPTISESYMVKYRGISYLAGVFFLNFAGIYVSLKRKRIAPYYILAYGFYLLSALLFSGMINGTIEYSWFVHHSGLLATTLFTVIISIGLSNKISSLRKEQEKTKEFVRLSQELSLHISEKNRLEETLKISLQLNEMLIDFSEDEIISFGLEQAQIITNSEIGYFHFVNEDQKTISLQKWSKNTMNFCTAGEKDEHYTIDKAGIWVECFYTKKPAVHNDYKNHPDKKGYPEGHFPVIRHMSVPIFEKEKICGIIGVGNKKSDYNNEDASQLLLLAENIWSVIRRKRAEEAVKNSEKELRELNKTKDKLFSIIAHDLKNPLGSMPSLTKVLMNEFDTISDSQKKELIKLIHETSGQSYKLLENLLIWSKSQRGKISFNPTKIYIWDLIEEVLLLVKPQAGKKSIVIKNMVFKDKFAFADYDMISAIIRNLITNAIKFTPNNGLITIRSELIDRKNNDRKLKISVIDTGIGMNPETLEKLFTIEQNISTKGTNNEEGTGLGLFLCKELIDYHKGKIWAESELGKGSKFHILLPLQ